MTRPRRPETAPQFGNDAGKLSVVTRIRSVISESLLRNSAFLVLNLMLGAACGYGSLILITHIFSVQAVGLSATAYSSSMLIVSLTQFGVSYSLPRYLPTATHRAALINTMMTAVILSTLIGAVVFLVLPFARDLFALGGWIFGVVFILGACFQAGETVLQVVLIADRAADKLAVAGVIPNVVRVAAPSALSVIGSLGAYAARVVPDLFGFFIFITLLVRRGHRFRPELSLTATRAMRRFSAGMYVANIIGSLPNLVLPLIVLSRVGAKGGAYWSVAITISSLLFQLPSVITQALLPEVSYRSTERRYLLRRSAMLITAVVVPALAIAWVGAPIALAFFGHAYVIGSLAALRWLIFAGFITMLNYVTGTVLFLAKKSLIVAVVNIVDAVVIFALVGFWATNVEQIAISWVIGDVGNTVLFGVFAFLALREVGGRWEDLGEKRAASAFTAAKELSATAQQLAAIDVLRSLSERQRASLAERQQTASMYRPYLNAMTAPHDLSSIIGLDAAEREQRREEQSAELSATSQQRALNLLFSLAEQQRTDGTLQPQHRRHRPRQDPSNPRDGGD